MLRPSRFALAALTSIAAVLLAVLVHTATTYSATLTGPNEVPPNASTAIGSATITLVSDSLTVDESFSGLIGGPASAAHIHCCASPGTNAPVAVALTGFPAATSGTYVNTFNLLDSATYSGAFLTAHGGTAAGAEAALIAGLNNGTAYVNIHNATFPGGEIRGNLAAVPTRIISLAGNLTFGDVHLGSTATSTLTISNNGNTTLTVSSITYPTGYGGDWAGGTIGAGAAQAVTITFTPVTATTYVGTLVVNADQTSGTPSIAVYGRTRTVAWRSGANGQNIGWVMNGMTVAASALLPTIADTNWEVKGVGDFDGDGKADVVWRNKVTGQDIAWLMNGLTVTNSAFLPTIADTNWEIVGVGDLNGDGKADVLLRNKASGQNIGWLMNGVTLANFAFLPTIADTNWEVKGVGDFNGDGKSDVIWRNKVSGQDIVWLMNGLTLTNSAFLPTIADTNWHIVGS